MEGAGAALRPAAWPGCPGKPGWQVHTWWTTDWTWTGWAAAPGAQLAASFSWCGWWVSLLILSLVSVFSMFGLIVTSLHFMGGGHRSWVFFFFNP